ncbi:hypothetical protein E2C01_099172 [Portunus trituberculatus]|uniref:Uncharacterized protein n=1 Tax=Portunus trituberculatus TaxID=210409 RepID=A0A5B7K364_PORTR|nr:hypothetical protein [Portunus trituberculatus]
MICGAVTVSLWPRPAPLHPAPPRSAPVHFPRSVLFLILQFTALFLLSHPSCLSQFTIPAKLLHPTPPLSGPLHPVQPRSLSTPPLIHHCPSRPCPPVTHSTSISAHFFHLILSSVPSTHPPKPLHPIHHTLHHTTAHLRLSTYKTPLTASIPDTLQ